MAGALGAAARFLDSGEHHALANEPTTYPIADELDHRATLAARDMARRWELFAHTHTLLELRDFRRLSAASATEAGTATDAEGGVVHEGAGPKDIAQ